MPQEPTRGAKGREERRARVVETAMRLAHEGGYDAVQMREVADRSGVALGTIYRYFNGKDDLLIAGLLGWVTRVRRGLEAQPAEGDNPEERLTRVLGSAARSADSSPVLLSALITALATTAPAAAEYKLAVEREVQQLVVTAIGDDADVDALGVARVVGHVWISAISRWVGGLAPAGSVEDELCHAVRMMVASRVPTRA